MIRIRIVAALGLIAAPLAAQSKGTVAPTADPLAGLVEYLEQVRAAWRIPGLAVGIVKDDSLIFARGVGLKEQGKPDSVTPRTLFAIGSNTKSFTATAAAMLVDDGKMRWNDRATRWLPSFQLYDPYVTRELTLRDVLSHRSGLGRRGDALWYGTDYSRDEILHRVRYLRPNAAFRTEMGYQNIMVMAGGEMVGRAAGMSYDDVIRQRIFGPLGMSTSGTSVTELSRQADVSTPHTLAGGAVKVIPWRNADNIAPAGSINSNIVEMAQYLRLQLGNGTYRGNRLVSVTNLGVTKTVHINTGGVGDTLTHFSGYGLGWVLQDYRGKRIAWHNGGIDGMLSEMWTVPEAGLGIVVLTNGSPHSAGPAIVWNIIDRFLVGRPTRDYLADGLKQAQQVAVIQETQAKRLESERVRDTKPSLALERYAGRYQDPMYGIATISVSGDSLHLQWQANRSNLGHWHFNTFRAPGGAGAAMVTFQIGRTGRVDRLDVEGLASFYPVN